MSSSTEEPRENDLKPLKSVTSETSTITTTNLPDTEETTGEEQNSTERVVTASSTEG